MAAASSTSVLHRIKFNFFPFGRRSTVAGNRLNEVEYRLSTAVNNRVEYVEYVMFGGW